MYHCLQHERRGDEYKKNGEGNKERETQTDGKLEPMNDENGLFFETGRNDCVQGASVVLSKTGKVRNRGVRS